jgi:signal transduction histidine kinase
LRAADAQVADPAGGRSAPGGARAASSGAPLARPALERSIRSLPIWWRILAIAVFNFLLAAVLLLLIWDGAQRLTAAWNDVRQIRQSEQLIVMIDSDAERLQNRIHRYFNQPDENLLVDLVTRSESLISRLRVQARLDPLISEVAPSLTETTERFLRGFDELRATRSAISTAYELDFLRTARELAGTYAVLDSATPRTESSLWPTLTKSREAFNSMLLAANAYYLSNAREAGEEAKRNAELIRRTAPVMLALAENEVQREALRALQAKAEIATQALASLADRLVTQARLLRDEIDSNAEAMAASTDQLTRAIRAREASAQELFGRALRDVETQVVAVAAGFAVIVLLMGIAISKSISDPLRQLRRAMLAIVAGEYRHPVAGREARDEIGEMAAAVEVFRENAIARQAAEDALRSAKERAETALVELRDAQASLVEAEKLAALGSLVAGVAHEVNNPVGISLTVASSLARRCRDFAAELEGAALKRSRLREFVAGNEEAAEQLVANLHRAGDLIQAFKQVAVDRSDGQRRRFDLRQACDQIASSLRPGVKNAQVQLQVDIPDGIVMDSYAGALGQVLTNLFLNAVTHGFRAGRAGSVVIFAEQSGRDHVALVVRDDGAGMSEDVQRRAFEPFFTTRRGEGGSGLGLHVVYNLVTGRLGGRIMLHSQPGAGTMFRMSLPMVAPSEEPARALAPGPVAIDG